MAEESRSITTEYGHSKSTKRFEVFAEQVERGEAPKTGDLYILKHVLEGMSSEDEGVPEKIRVTISLD